MLLAGGAVAAGMPAVRVARVVVEEGVLLAGGTVEAGTPTVRVVVEDGDDAGRLGRGTWTGGQRDRDKRGAPDPGQSTVTVARVMAEKEGVVVPGMSMAPDLGPSTITMARWRKKSGCTCANALAPGLAAGGTGVVSSSFSCEQKT